MTNSKEVQTVSDLTVTLDPQKTAEIFKSCTDLFTQLLEDEDEDRALANIVSTSLLIYNSFPSDVPVACGKGCSYCCHQPVAINLAEARTIALSLPSLPDDVRKDSLKKLKKQKNLTLTKYGETGLNKKYPCPFLHEDGSCRIYEVRPLACRRYTSTSLADCIASLDGDKSVTITMIPQYRIVAELISAAVTESLQQHVGSADAVKPAYGMVAAVHHIVKDRGIT